MNDGPWQSVSDGLLSGLVHALNNRAATISAAAQLLESERGDVAMLGRTLQEEVRKLEELLRLLRMLERGRTSRPEPIHVPELLADVESLVRHHRDLRQDDCVFEGTTDVLPVIAQRSELTHALLLLAGAVHDTHPGPIALRWSDDGESVIFEVGPATGSRATEITGLDGAPDTGWVRAMAERSGGELCVRGSKELSSDVALYELRVPALRRRA